jgi:hypothetical protein
LRSGPGANDRSAIFRKRLFQQLLRPD